MADEDVVTYTVSYPLTFDIDVEPDEERDREALIERYKNDFEDYVNQGPVHFDRNDFTVLGPDDVPPTIDKDVLIAFFNEYNLVVLDQDGDDFAIDHVLGMIAGQQEIPEAWSE